MTANKICFYFAFVLAMPFASSGQLQGFVMSGNPQLQNGATWTYQDSVNGIWYDLQGILFIPDSASPPYPAVIINHGTGGNVNGYSKNIAQEMVQWNYVCIATNLCHSGGVAIGSPGDTSFSNFGASTNNYLRAMKCWEILASLGDVDTNCITAFGHSRGAYTTTGLVASYPDKFSCAGHTAGGAITQSGYAAPTTALASQITCAYIMHHGDSDNVVPVQYDYTLNNVFDSTGIPHQLHVYSGYSHQQMSMDSLMFVRTHDWFTTHTCLATSSNEIESPENSLMLFPNPSNGTLRIESGAESFLAEIYTMAGAKIFSGNFLGTANISLAGFDSGMYVVKICRAKHPVMFQKLILVR